MNDMLPNHDELANYELSIDELDAVAAGSIFGDVWNWIKGEVNDRVNEYKAYAGMIVETGRALRHLF